MRTIRTIAATLAATVLVASPAFADEKAPEGDEPVRAAEVDPTLETGETTPAPKDAAPAEEEPAEEASPTSGWFRIDTDSLETQFWLGATHQVGSIAIASDIYVVGSFAEFDIGPSFSIGNLALTPMVGLGFDFSTQDVASLIAPQLFTIYGGDKIYVESWIQVFLNDMFADGSADSFYTRNFVLYNVNDQLAVGPQAELTYQLNDTTDDMGATMEADVVSLPIGGRVNVGYGEKNTLGLFLGYDTQAAEGSDGIAGRFTFVRTW
jgi:hypothetical protein